MVLEQLHIDVQNNVVGPLYLIIFKLNSKWNHRPKCKMETLRQNSKSL